MDKGLFYLISDFQTGDSKAAEKLVIQFKPLLNHYAYLLNREDSFEDLQLHFLIGIKKVPTGSLSNTSDGALTNYFKQIVRNSYIQLSKQKRITATSFDDSDIADSLEYQCGNQTVDNYDKLFFDDLGKVLTEKEYMVICLHYLQEISIAEIASHQKATRQTINGIKLNALKKLKSFLQ